MRLNKQTSLLGTKDSFAKSSNKIEMFADDPYFNNKQVGSFSGVDIDLNSPFDRMKLDPSHVYEGLDVMNMSQE